MALKEYYELSAMLRMQLPILLSFAVIRCLMGAVANFWLRRLVPERLKTMWQPVGEATANTLSFLHVVLLIASVFFTVINYNVWRDTPAHTLSKVVPSLVCSEFAIVRVQGLTCATGLLALFTSSDPMALGLALSLFKAVADGSVIVLALAAFTWRACLASHKTAPRWFFGALFTFNVFYSSFCYTDDAFTNRTGGATLATSFGGLMVLHYISMWCLGRTASLGSSAGHRVKRGTLSLVLKARQAAERHAAHAHAD